jgi:hypothetical protein
MTRFVLSLFLTHTAIVAVVGAIVLLTAALLAGYRP